MGVVMKVIIDARSRLSFERIYNIPLFERILRQLNELKADAEAVIIISPEQKSENLLSKGFLKRYNISHRFVQSGESFQTVIRTVAQHEKDLILLEGDGIYDERIISALLSSEKAIWVKDGGRNVPLAARLGAEHIKTILSSSAEISETLKDLERFEIQSMNNYVRFLRRSVVPMLMRLESPKDIRSIENTMYTNTFKGTLELVAVYGYRIPVRELTRLTAKTPITPNMVTAAAQICSFGAIPALANGWLWTGLLMAAGFIIFDSLDGKLARMTIRLSKVADNVDHLASAPTRTGWYLGMGWHLSGGNLLSTYGYFAMAYAAMPVIDKLTGAVFNAKFGRSPLDYTPLDGKVHLFTVRRNDIFLLLNGMLFGFIHAAYIIAACWAVLTWLWHLYRLIWFSFVSGTEKDA